MDSRFAPQWSHPGETIKSRFFQCPRRRCHRRRRLLARARPSSRAKREKRKPLPLSSALPRSICLSGLERCSRTFDRSPLVEKREEIQRRRREKKREEERRRGKKREEERRALVNNRSAPLAFSLASTSSPILHLSSPLFRASLPQPPPPPTTTTTTPDNTQSPNVPTRVPFRGSQSQPSTQTLLRN